MMDRETFLTAQEALDAGLLDEIIGAGAGTPVNPMNVFNAVGGAPDIAVSYTHLREGKIMVLEIDYEPKARPLRIGVYTDSLPDTKRNFNELCRRSGAEIAMETLNWILLRDETKFIFLKMCIRDSARADYHRECVVIRSGAFSFARKEGAP